MLVDAGCNQDQPRPTSMGGVMVVGYTFRLTTTIITTIVTQQQGTQMASKQDPSPTEISAACLLIQSGWTEAERMKRLRVDLRPMYQPCDGVTEEMTAAVYEGHHGQREKITCSIFASDGVPF